MINLVLLDSLDSFGSKVNIAISNELNKFLRRKSNAIFRDIRGVVPSWVLNQPEMEDISSTSAPGSLAAQLGLFRGSGPNIAKTIASAVADSLTFELVRINSKDLTGGLKINFMPTTFANLLNLPEGRVIQGENNLHWLSWLIKDGFKVVVAGYSYKFQNNAGRSGGGLMQEGGVWRVPPQYAGTYENNFVTRALLGQEQEETIFRIFQRHFQ